MVIKQCNHGHIYFTRNLDIKRFLTLCTWVLSKRWHSIFIWRHSWYTFRWLQCITERCLWKVVFKVNICISNHVFPMTSILLSKNCFHKGKERRAGFLNTKQITVKDSKCSFQRQYNLVGGTQKRSLALSLALCLEGAIYLLSDSNLTWASWRYHC